MQKHLRPTTLAEPKEDHLDQVYRGMWMYVGHELEEGDRRSDHRGSWMIIKVVWT